jgi:hypothetical protein
MVPYTGDSYQKQNKSQQQQQQKQKERKAYWDGCGME